jgi:hypothetical protein
MAPINVAANGPFAFRVAMPMGASYSVTVSGQPVGQSCEVWNGSGTVGASPVGSVFVTCTAVDRTVSGTVSGLLAGRSLVLQDDGGNSTPVSADGGFTFSTPVAGGSNYASDRAHATCGAALRGDGRHRHDGIERGFRRRHRLRERHVQRRGHGRGSGRGRAHAAGRRREPAGDLLERDFQLQSAGGERLGLCGERGERAAGPDVAR